MPILQVSGLSIWVGNRVGIWKTIIKKGFLNLRNPLVFVARTTGLDAPTYEVIVKLCDEQELGIAEWVRDAIEIKLSQGENQGDEITEG